MDLTDLRVFWFFLLGVLLAGYAVLDGFDLGVGVLHPFVRGDRDRRLVLNAIGPLWDGNEVWLVTFGGALFAAFPRAYATLLSGFYLPFMVLLACIIGRAISIEFRSKRDSPLWRAYWDLSFSLSSGLALFVMGVAVGNVLAGVPIGADGEMRAPVLDLLRPYPALVGCFAVAAGAMHGSIFLYLKTEGELQERIHGWMWLTFGIFLALYAAVSILTLIQVPHATENFRRWPLAWVVVALNVLAVANIPRAIHKGMPRYAFVSSAATIVALTFLLGMAIFPNLAVSSLDPRWSLTVWAASSSDDTLRIMRIIAFIGMPFVAAYTGIVYWVFRGKVKLGENSY